MIISDKFSINQSIHWTEYGIPIRNLWHKLLYAWNETPATNTGSMEDIENSPTLDALLTSILMKLMQQRLRIGLGRNYVDEKQLLRGIRGRINFTDSLKTHAFEHGQVHCEFQQYSVNVPKNQIIRSTLIRLVQMGNFGPDRAQAEELRHKLRWIIRSLDGIDLIELKLDFIRRQQIGRNDRDSYLMLAICELILQRQMPTDSDGQHRLPSINRDALTLHNIYERFVANFYRIHLKGWTVTKQKQLSWNAKVQNQFLPFMYPDLVLEEKSSRRIVVLDTKFTANSIITNQRGGKGFDSHHLYQLYAYLKTQEHVSDQHRRAEGILLYPAINKTEISESINLQDQTMRVVTVDLTKAWQDVEQRLIELIEV